MDSYDSSIAVDTPGHHAIRATILINTTTGIFWPTQQQTAKAYTENGSERKDLETGGQTKSYWCFSH